MYNSRLICSLLVAFCLSIMVTGCAPPASNSGTTSKTAAPKGDAKAGSTTGGGAEVPAAPGKGAAEKPKAK